MPSETQYDKRKLTHNQLRLKVCVVCFNESGKKATRDLITSEEDYIKENIIIGYSSDDLFLPGRLCENCHFSLLKDRKKAISEIQPSETYQQIKRSTRSSILNVEKEDCDCIVCERGRLYGLELRR